MVQKLAMISLLFCFYITHLECIKPGLHIAFDIEDQIVTGKDNQVGVVYGENDQNLILTHTVSEEKGSQSIEPLFDEQEEFSIPQGIVFIDDDPDSTSLDHYNIDMCEFADGETVQDDAEEWNIEVIASHEKEKENRVCQHPNADMIDEDEIAFIDQHCKPNLSILEQDYAPKYLTSQLINKVKSYFMTEDLKRAFSIRSKMRQTNQGQLKTPQIEVIQKMKEFITIPGEEENNSLKYYQTGLATYDQLVYVSPDSGHESDNDEHKPLNYGYYIGKNEVTNRQYAEFLKESGHPAPKTWIGGEVPKGLEDEPVTDIAYIDAENYARWKGMRLPTHDEWVKAIYNGLIDEDSTIEEWILLPDDRDSLYHRIQQSQLQGNDYTGFRLANDVK